MGVKRGPIRVFDFLSSNYSNDLCEDQAISIRTRSLIDADECSACETINLKPINKLFLGDNLHVLCYLIRQGFSEAFQMIYIDPPFYSDKEYYISRKIKKVDKTEEKLQQVAYRDTWESLEDYLRFLFPRFVLIKQLLRKDGTLFVHLDWHASHYVKILLDTVMGPENFRNEIIWCYTGPNRSKQDFPKKHDVILRYSKSRAIKFHPIYTPYRSGIHDTRGTAMRYKGKSVDFSAMEKRGKQLEDWWTDIWAAERYRSDFTYYGTEKPKKLLERLILSATDPGDLIGDFFAGSGTTLVVAKELGRSWVGADNSIHAINLVRTRLLDSRNPNQETVHREPFDEYFSLSRDHRLLRSNSELEKKSIRWRELVEQHAREKKENAQDKNAVINIANPVPDLLSIQQRHIQFEQLNIAVAYPIEFVRDLTIFRILPSKLQDEIKASRIFFWEQPKVSIKLEMNARALRIEKYRHTNPYVVSFYEKNGIEGPLAIDQVLLSRFNKEEETLLPFAYWSSKSHQENTDRLNYRLNIIGDSTKKPSIKPLEHIVELIDLLGFSSFYFL